MESLDTNSPSDTDDGTLASNHAPLDHYLDQERQRLISEIKYVDIHELKPHPLNESIYGKVVDEELLESIRVNGVLQPILATWENVVLGGHQRLEYARQVGLTQVPVVLTDSRDEDDMIEVLLDSNLHRKKSPEQLAREIQHRQRIERAKAAKRQATAAKGKRGGQFDPAKSPEAVCDVREIVAKKVGVGVKTVDAAVKAIKTMQEFEQAGEVAKAAEIKVALNRSINAGKGKAEDLKKAGAKLKAPSASREKKKLIRQFMWEFTCDLHRWPLKRLQAFAAAAIAFRRQWEHANIQKENLPVPTPSVTAVA